MTSESTAPWRFGFTPELKERTNKYLSANKVVLFMKGTKTFAQSCGFSNTCVQLLNTLSVPYETVNLGGSCVLAPGGQGMKRTLTTTHLSTTLHQWWIFWWLWYHTLWAFSFKLWPRSILGKNLCSKYLWAIKIGTSVFGRELYAHESSCWLERMHVSGIQLVF